MCVCVCGRERERLTVIVLLSHVGEMPSPAGTKGRGAPGEMGRWGWEPDEQLALACACRRSASAARGAHQGAVQPRAQRRAQEAVKPASPCRQERVLLGVLLSAVGIFQSSYQG